MKSEEFAVIFINQLDAMQILETGRIKKSKQKKNSTGGGCVRWFKRHEKKEENQVIASNAETLSKRSDLFIIVASVKNKKEKKLCLP